MATSTYGEFKLVVVGCGGVGKSAVTVRFIQNKFVEKYDPTIEDSYRKQIEFENEAVLLDILDTAGQEDYSALRDQFMKQGDGFLILYSITSASSFDYAIRLRSSVLRLKDEDPTFPMILIGNKQDLEHERVISTAEGQAKAKKMNFQFIETSAKSNLNIQTAFMDLVKSIHKWREDNPDKSPKKQKQKGSPRCIVI